MKRNDKKHQQATTAPDMQMASVRFLLNIWIILFNTWFNAAKTREGACLQTEEEMFHTGSSFNEINELDHAE